MKDNPKRKQIDLIRTLEVQTATYQQENMVNFIICEVKKIAPEAKITLDEGNVYVVKGEALTYPCVVSHMDTVHSLYPNSRVFNFNGKLFTINGVNMERVGCGGDDKVGVFICLEALRYFDNIKLAFFRDEEVGCHGSAKADMTFFQDVSLALQCDRKGYRDFVNSISGTKLYTKEFSKEISPLLKRWGRRETSGGLTDVYQLAENGLGVCTANMSCGYYDPHTRNEYVVVSEVMDTLQFVIEVIELCHKDGERWEIKHDVWTYYSRGRDYYGGLYDDYYGYQGSTTGSKDVKWIHSADEDIDCTCPMCQSDHAVYYDDTEGDHYCYTCRMYFNEIEEYMQQEPISDEEINDATVIPLLSQHIDIADDEEEK